LETCAFGALPNNRPCQRSRNREEIDDHDGQDNRNDDDRKAKRHPRPFVVATQIADHHHREHKQNWLHDTIDKALGQMKFNAHSSTHLAVFGRGYIRLRQTQDMHFKAAPAPDAKLALDVSLAPTGSKIRLRKG
jgi:hypothetical protein